MSRVVVYLAAHSVRTGDAGDDAPRAKLPRRRDLSSGHEIVRALGDAGMERGAGVFVAAAEMGAEEQRDVASALFEDFDASAVYFANREQCAMYLLGVSGVCIHSGTDTTSVCCVYSDHPMPHTAKVVARRVLPIGGAAVTAALRDRLPNSPAEEIAQLKMEHARVAASRDDAAAAAARPHVVSTAGDGAVDLAGVYGAALEELFSGPEPLADVVLQLCASFHEDVQHRLLANIVLTGGNTRVRGFADRLRADIRARDPTLDVREADGDLCYPFAGASAIASLTNISAMWLSRREYDEGGPDAVARKCALVHGDVGASMSK